MTITKYTYDNLAGTGFQWHPVTDEGEVLFYPCGELKGVKVFVEACGYDGKAQQDFIESWAEQGVSVF